MFRPICLGAAVACGLVALACAPLLTAHDVQEDVDLTLDSGGGEFTNSVGMKFVRVRAGRFMMGSPQTEAGSQTEERPQHQVTMTKDYYVGVHEVTQKQYEAVMGKNTSDFRKGGAQANSVQGMDTGDFPADSVTFEDALAFVDKLNALSGEKRFRVKYRLPTEAEWEYACRGGHKIAQMGKSAELPFHFRKPSASLGFGQANFDSNSPYNGGKAGQPLNRPCKVGSYESNPLGIHDMHGNVWEWCSDWWSTTVYGEKDRKDPKGPASGSQRTLRGGAYGNNGDTCRAARRLGYNGRSSYVGFRVACSPAR
jgi:formylglycine-generating enzyme required for sulfatase activity